LVAINLVLNILKSSHSIRKVSEVRSKRSEGPSLITKNSGDYFLTEKKIEPSAEELIAARF
jgi:hypothetical protein